MYFWLVFTIVIIVISQSDQVFQVSHFHEVKPDTVEGCTGFPLGEVLFICQRSDGKVTHCPQGTWPLYTYTQVVILIYLYVCMYVCMHLSMTTYKYEFISMTTSEKQHALRAMNNSAAETSANMEKLTRWKPQTTFHDNKRRESLRSSKTSYSYSY
jgi:hypothetical protein